MDHRTPNCRCSWIDRQHNKRHRKPTIGQLLGTLIAAFVLTLLCLKTVRGEPILLDHMDEIIVVHYVDTTTQEYEDQEFFFYRNGTFIACRYRHALYPYPIVHYEGSLIRLTWHDHTTCGRYGAVLRSVAANRIRGITMPLPCFDHEKRGLWAMRLAMPDLEVPQ